MKDREGPSQQQDTGTATLEEGTPEGSAILPGIGFALLSAGAFGAIAPVAKIAYDRGGEPLPLLGIRFVVAAVLLALIHRGATRTLRVPRGTGVRLLLLGGVAFAAESWLFFGALEVAPAGIVSLIFFSFPLVTAVISFTFKLEPPRPQTFVAIMLGSAGVASIFGIAGIEVRGLVLALGAGVVVAIYFVLAGIFIQGVLASVAATWTTAGAAITLSAAALLSGQQLPAPALPAGVGLGLLTTVAFTALYAAIGRIGASRAAVAQMFEPIWTVVIAAVLLGETITGRIVFGAVLIISSLPVLSARRRPRPPAPAPDSL